MDKSSLLQKVHGSSKQQTLTAQKQKITYIYIYIYIYICICIFRAAPILVSVSGPNIPVIFYGIRILSVKHAMQVKILSYILHY